MGNVSYDPRHPNWVGRQGVWNHLPWQFIKKNIFILGAAGYNTLLPPVGHLRPFQSTALVPGVMDDASHNRRHPNQAEGWAHTVPSTSWAIWKWPRHLIRNNHFFGVMGNFYYLSCFCCFLSLFFLHGPISTSCFKSISFPDFSKATMNPLSQSSAAWWLHNFLHVLNLLVCNIIWFFVNLIFAAYSNNLEQCIHQHVIPGLPAEFTD